MFETSQAKQIRNLLSTLALGVVFACLIAAYFLVYHNPEGRYLAKNVLLSPSIAKEMSYVEGNTRFIFSDIILVSPDGKRTSVDLNTYGALYQALSKDESLLPVSEKIQRDFMTGVLPTLEILVRSDKGEAQRVFQRIQFSLDGKYYRVELKQQGIDDPWAYYSHPNILPQWQRSSF